MKPNQGILSISRYDMHKQKLAAKQEKAHMLQALYDEWLPFRDEHHPEMVELRRRLKAVENQLRNMRP